MSTIATTSQPAISSPVRRLITGHPLLAFFVIAFAGEWIVTLPLVISAVLLLTAVSRDVLAIRVLRRTATQTSAVTPSPSPSLT